MKYMSGRQLIFSVIGMAFVSIFSAGNVFASDIAHTVPYSGYNHVFQTANYTFYFNYTSGLYPLLRSTGGIYFDGTNHLRCDVSGNSCEERSNTTEFGAWDSNPAHLITTRELYDWSNNSVMVSANAPENWFPVVVVNYLENIGLFMSTMSPLLLTILGGFIAVIAFSRLFRFIKRQLANPSADIQRARSVAGHTDAILRRMDRGGSFDR